MTKKDIQLEGRLSRLEEQVREIRENHLAHIAQDIKDLDIKIDGYREEFNEKIDRGNWLAITVLVGVIVTLGTLWLK